MRYHNGSHGCMESKLCLSLHPISRPIVPLWCSFAPSPRGPRVLGRRRRASGLWPRGPLPLGGGIAGVSRPGVARCAARSGRAVGTLDAGEGPRSIQARGPAESRLGRLPPRHHDIPLPRVSPWRAGVRQALLPCVCSNLLRLVHAPRLMIVRPWTWAECSVHINNAERSDYDA